MSDTVSQYCLRWNNHHSRVTSGFVEFFLSEAFTDVTLVCERASIKCHKIILAACSTYFQNLLMFEKECLHPVVVLADMKLSEILTILEYMYRGEVTVAGDQLAGVMETAKNLGVRGLVEEDSDSDSSSTSSSDVPENSLPVVSHSTTPPLSPVQLTLPGTPVKNDSILNQDKDKEDSQTLITILEPLKPSPLAVPEQRDQQFANLSGSIVEESSHHNEKVTVEGQLSQQFLENAILNVQTGSTYNSPYSTDTEDKLVQRQLKRYKMYSKTALTSAIEAVKKGMSALTAAKTFDIPSRTLYMKLKKLGIATGGNGPNRIRGSPIQASTLTLDESATNRPRNELPSLLGNGNGSESVDSNHGMETGDNENSISETGFIVRATPETQHCSSSPVIILVRSIKA